MTGLLELPVALIPVVAFLASLVILDSFKLVSVRSVVQTIVIGGLAAGLSYAVNRWFLNAGVEGETFVRYGAPLVEEILKAAYVAYLLHSRRVGFIVDAGIYGFAAGAGFALVENIYYLSQLPDAGLSLWIVRGLGTAIMHGSTTAMFAILGKSLLDRHPRLGLLNLLPGFALAFAVHSAFNHLALNPLLQTLLLLLIMPPLTVLVFERSERATREWLGTGFDSDVELLELVTSGRIREDRIGTYLESLKSRFPGQVVGDMLCLLQVHLELSVRAKGILMAREAGVRLEPDEMVKANLQELRFLEKSVGKTGKLAMLPFLNMGSRDLWQLYMLGK